MIRLFIIRTFSLLFFRAFRPEKTDYRHILTRRMPGRALALLNIGPGGIKVGCAKVNKARQFEFQECKSYPVTALNDEILKDVLSKTDCASVAVCFNSPTGLCDYHKLIRLKDTEIPTKLIKNPQVIYGEHYEKDRTYALLQHPKLEVGISFSVSREELAKVEDTLRRAGLTVMRTQIGSYNLLNYLLALPEFGEGVDTPTDVIRVPLALDQTFATAVFVLAGNWGPQSLLFHRSIVPSVLSRNTDLFEQQEKIVSYFTEFAEAARRNLGRGAETMVEFALVNSQTPPDSFGLISQFMEQEKNIRFAVLPAPCKDLEFEILLSEIP